MLLGVCVVVVIGALVVSASMMSSRIDRTELSKRIGDYEDW